MKRPPDGQTFEFDSKTGDRIRCWWNTALLPNGDEYIIETHWAFTRDEWKAWEEWDNPKYTVSADRKFIDQHAFHVKYPELFIRVRALETAVREADAALKTAAKRIRELTKERNALLT